MDQARGGVLFIDEAYDLGGPGFGREAMNTLLGMMTEPECVFAPSSCVVVAAVEGSLAMSCARESDHK